MSSSAFPPYFHSILGGRLLAYHKHKVIIYLFGISLSRLRHTLTPLFLLALFLLVKRLTSLNFPLFSESLARSIGGIRLTTTTQNTNMGKSAKLLKRVVRRKIRMRIFHLRANQKKNQNRRKRPHLQLLPPQNKGLQAHLTRQSLLLATLRSPQAHPPKPPPQNAEQV